MSSNPTQDAPYLRIDRLRAARERRGLSQRDLSKLLEIGDNQINKYENGGAEPSLRVLYRIAEQLGVTADYLIGLSDDPHGYMSADLRTDERQLLDAYTVGDSTTILKLVTDRLRLLEGEKS